MVKIIILKKSILGNVGDIISVKFGYARNYLVPYNKALYFNKKNLDLFNEKKKVINKIKNKRIKDFNKFYNKIILLSPMNLYYRCSRNGKLFSSFKVSDMCKVLFKKIKFKISKKNIFFPNGPIKYIGKHIINIIFLKNKKLDFVINIISIK